MRGSVLVFEVSMSGMIEVVLFIGFIMICVGDVRVVGLIVMVSGIVEYVFFYFFVFCF